MPHNSCQIKCYVDNNTTGWQFDSAPQGLVFPSRFVFKALCIAESVLRCELEKDWLGKKYFFDYVNIKICNSFVSIHSIMKKMDNHCYDLLKEQHDESSFFSLSLSLLSLSLSLSLSIFPLLQSVPLTLFFLSRCFLKILESCELLCCHKMQKFCKEKKWRPKKKRLRSKLNKLVLFSHQ